MSGQPSNLPSVRLLNEEGICVLSLDSGELRKCYNYAEEYEKAAESLEMGINAAENKIAKDDLILIVVKNNLAYAYEQKGEYKKSIALLEETLPIQQEIVGKSNFDTLKILVYLIEQYRKIKGLAKAISLLEELHLFRGSLLRRNTYTALKLYEHMVSVRQKKLEPGDEQRKWAEVRSQKCIETWKWTWARR
ncbi:calcium-independent phospholipase A2-gamma [Fusarium tjaetaba]|uniref:Calcium-independent phospholipase A2-gamma n=1 Tax=Fusarium tjaetaba TaxID=1567544 RepID=A0A8H5W117_9HYPO|nr:calcium-independent phospholipase A2-gamma [Fusarium tjaetaba]KAF5641448.1 calcium-independent phospholipase A2-gamma [Fusarium tjaetaba]